MRSSVIRLGMTAKLRQRFSGAARPAAFPGHGATPSILRHMPHSPVIAASLSSDRRSPHKSHRHGSPIDGVRGVYRGGYAIWRRVLSHHHANRAIRRRHPSKYIRGLPRAIVIPVPKPAGCKLYPDMDFAKCSGRGIAMLAICRGRRLGTFPAIADQHLAYPFILARREKSMLQPALIIHPEIVQLELRSIPIFQTGRHGHILLFRDWCDGYGRARTEPTI